MSEYSAKIKLDAGELFKLFPSVGKRGRQNKLDNINGFVETFNDYADYFGIDTPLEVRHFVAQVATESDQFNAFEEYASGAAYEGRKDLGNTHPGDGRKFKGHGPGQVTGLANHAKAGRALLALPFLTIEEKELFVGDGILSRPTILVKPKYGTLAFLNYWAERNLNERCKPDGSTVTIRRLINGKWRDYQCSPIEAVTRGVNGGVNGLDDRAENYRKLSRLIPDDTAGQPATTPRPILCVGMTGDDVRDLQQALRVDADGEFGAATAAALVAFQGAHGLEPDGVAGPNTWRALGLMQ